MKYTREQIIYARARAICSQARIICSWAEMNRDAGFFIKYCVFLEKRWHRAKIPVPGEKAPSVADFPFSVLSLRIQ